MQPLPHPLLPLIYASLVLSAAGVALSTLNINDSPPMWVVPGAFILSLPWHIGILLIARLEPHGSERIFSSLIVKWAFLITFLWTCSFGVVLTFTILTGLKQGFGVPVYLMIAGAAVILVECGVAAWIAVACRKERKRITYMTRWRPVQSQTSAQSWSIGRMRS